MEREYSQKYRQIMRLSNKEVVFDATETPFTVKPELSGLADSNTVAEAFQSKYPGIVFSRACLADGNILIQDIDAPPSGKSELGRIDEVTNKAIQLNETSSVTLQVVDGREMTEDLLQLLSRNAVFDKNPLIVLPGNGSQAVRKYLERVTNSNLNNAVSVPTTRTMLPSKKFAISVDFSVLPKKNNFDRAIIFDDVVASGQTARRIGSQLKSVYPDIECILASWITLFPSEYANMDISSGVYGIDQTYTSIALMGNGLPRPPINSLSCFIDTENNEAYQQRKEAYKRKYILNPVKFEQQLALIRSSLSK